MEKERMNHSPNEKPSETDESVSQDSDGAAIAPKSDGVDPSESIKQEKYRREYLRQIRLRSCPGCGDDEIV
jgi:hypothetical protein